MNLSFKVLNMCDTCVHNKCAPHEYQTRCKKYASARFAIELLPKEMLFYHPDAYAAIACNEYLEIAIEPPAPFDLADALTMIKENCASLKKCSECAVFDWCNSRDCYPQNWFIPELKKEDV